jgi:hypothetical protein
VTIVELHQNRNIYKVGFSYNNYYKMTKKGLFRKIAQGGAVAGLSLLPVLAEGQDYSKIQKGVNARTVKGETPTHVIFHYGMNKDLQKAIKSSKKPHLYLTGDKNSYMIVDSDTSGFKIYYNKKNFDEGGNGKVPFVVNIKGDEHINPCDENGLGSKTNYLVSFYDLPSRGVSTQPISQPTEPSKEPASNYNQTIINKDSHDTYINNHFYGDTTRAREAQQKLSSLELRTLIEGFKTINGPYSGGSAALQIGNGNLWIGPYGAFRFGSEKDSTPIFNKTLVSQAAQIFAETEGMSNAKLACPTEIGVIASINTNNDLFRIDFSYGIVNKVAKSREYGYDRKVSEQNGVRTVFEEKPYGPTQEQKSGTWVPTQKLGVSIQPSQKVPIYIKGEVEHRGKISDKKGPVYFNGAVGGNIRWRKK